MSKQGQKNRMWLLGIAAVVVLAAVAIWIGINPFSLTKIPFGDIDPAQAQELIKSQEENTDFVVLDVRTPEEYAEAHLHVQRNDLLNVDFYEPNFQDEINLLDKDKTYLVYCRSGNRSSQTVALMKELGFEKLYQLEGGILAWQQEDLPVKSGS